MNRSGKFLILHNFNRARHFGGFCRFFFFLFSSVLSAYAHLQLCAFDMHRHIDVPQHCLVVGIGLSGVHEDAVFNFNVEFVILLLESHNLFNGTESASNVESFGVNA